VSGRYSAGVVWPDPRPAATRVLVCFSYCGGGTAPFRPWVPALPRDVDLALVCLPGRERRIAEPPAERWEDLIAEALTSVWSVVDRPYVLFGHSLGAWIAFDVAVHMERHVSPPRALVVSASNAPSRAADENLRGPTSRTGDQALVAWLRRVGQLPGIILADPGLRQLTLDLFRADKRAAESYRFTPGQTVACDLRRLSGVADVDVDDDDGAWSALAAGSFRSDRLPGGHFYTDAVWSTLPRYLGL
jgi:surfactin synthase thioesterase subunit